jgi:Fic family protein
MYVAKAPTLQELWSTVPPERFVAIYKTIRDVVEGEYIHWDKLRHLDPPGEINHQEWWLGLKMARGAAMRSLPLRSSSGERFRYMLPDEVLMQLHYIDQHSSGEIAMPEVVTADEQARQHYLVNSLMEEAIRSSQLEGASTSRTVAKELLQSGRPPKDRSERMILNNYRASRFIRDLDRDDLTPGHVLEMQRIITEGTLDNPDAAGRLQTVSDERVAVFDRVTGDLLHEPPPADQLQERLEAMCAFANGEDGQDLFLHPVLRSIVLHLWLAYDHPFEDGNGRTARLLFYWSMRRHGYWLAEYLSISRILRQAPSQYARSFVLTESDEFDGTYFLISQLGVIRRAIEELQTYLKRKVREVQSVEAALRGSGDFNHRQLALLSHALRTTGASYTFATHAATHGVTHETARTDLLELEARDLLVRSSSGRPYRFGAASDLAARLAPRGARQADAAAVTPRDDTGG